MWNDKTVSVVFPAYNEEEGIVQAIEDFTRPAVDEILVIYRPSRDRTEELVLGTWATLVVETRPGYGMAIQRGLREAKGDYIIVSEPDGTFRGKDITKLLEYADEFDMVVGTRTNIGMIQDGANMGVFLRWGNYFVGKLLSSLFPGTSLTDVGCSYRLIRRPALEKIVDQFTCNGPEFSPEMMAVALKNGLRVVEVPLSYGARCGTSKITGSTSRAMKLGFSMISHMVRMKLQQVFSERQLSGGKVPQTWPTR